MLTAKTAVVAGVVTLCGLAASVSCFFLGQAILRGNGFTYENGYPAASLADGATLRAVAGTGIYLGLLAAFALGVGAVVRHTAGAITLVLALLLGPVIALSFLPESIAGVLEKTSLMAAGISIQQTVEGPDALALGPWAGLGVVSAYVAVALLGACWVIVRRDA